MIICLAGRIGSGKTTIANVLVSSHGFIKLSFAEQLIAPVVREAGLEVNRRSLQHYGQKLLLDIGEQGMTAALLAGVRDDRDYVVDDVRYVKTAQMFKDDYGAALVFVAASEDMRFRRVRERKREHVTRKRHLSELDSGPTEREIDHLLELADSVITNDADCLALKDRVGELLCTISK